MKERNKCLWQGWLFDWEELEVDINYKNNVKEIYGVDICRCYDIETMREINKRSK